MKGFFRAPWRFAACYAAFLIAAFTWALLDTFVIPHRELIVSRARDVAEEVLAAIRGQEQDDAAYERRKFRHKAHYSLNREDGIENDALNRPLTPEEILEQKQLREEVYAALMQLTAIQARRIYARFYLGMTVAEIAQIEGTDRRRVWDSIRRGLKKLARLLDAAR